MESMWARFVSVAAWSMRALLGPSSQLLTTASLKTAAITEAGAFCKTSGKQARVIDVKDTQAWPMGGWPEAEVLFKCE